MYCKCYLNLHRACVVSKHYAGEQSKQGGPHGKKIGGVGFMKDFLRNDSARNYLCQLATDLDTAKIDQITGLKGKMNEKEGVYKVTFPAMT